MDIEVKYRPAHSLGVVTMSRGDSITAEAGAMVTMNDRVESSTKARAGKKGGLFKSLKRSLFTGESFFTNIFSARDDGAEVTLAPSLCGDMMVHDLSPADDLMIQSTSYLASDSSISLDTQWQGMKAIFSGESFFFLKASGSGQVVMSAFGGMEVIELDGDLIVDTGHLVAFTSGISYRTTKPGSSWLQAFFSGEGIVLHVSGKGRLYLQSRNPSEYGQAVGGKLPAREG
jgi:uncharacterized protein (TIGR00266 family)